MHAPFKFELIHQSKKSRARVGKIHTPHGIINTPHFVPVGTNAAVKALDSVIVDNMGVDLMFSNTYHLMLQPGTKAIADAGGIHKFMNRTKPIITDSGGFQVFSLMYGSVHNELKSRGTKREGNSILKINEEGVLFRSYRDGARVLLTPETSIRAQKEIGADLIVSFDELPPFHMDEKKLKQSFERTHRWELRSLAMHQAMPNNQALYAVIHGGLDFNLRKQSIDILSAHAFDGFAIGGSLGKSHEDLFTLLDFMMPHMPYDRPNHLLGIGDLKSIDQIVRMGIDTFDSSHPTKSARHGHLFTKQGIIRAVAHASRNHYRPIEDDCTCYTCQHYTLAYICHLFKSNELTAFTLATIHNIAFMVRKMETTRQMILNDEI